MPQNLVLLGAALQRGALPVSVRAMEQAIELNGTSVEENLAALAWGRACVAAPDAVAALDGPPAAAVAPAAANELERLLAIRIDELTAYGGSRCAKEYEAAVREVATAEQAAGGAAGRVSEAVARQLFKLMAYKDEYEVARLHLDPVQRAQIKATYGDRTKVVYHLHPPLLRGLGLKRKLKLGPWFNPFFRLLRSMRRVRGHWYDPFGHAEVRRVERALIGEYRAQVDQAVAALDSANQASVAALCELPDMIRGYEHIKLANVALWRERSAAALQGLSGEKWAVAASR
jgi:indolepyruvate ferredoxin oxidoreductase